MYKQVVVNGHVITGIELSHSCGHNGRWVGTCDNAFVQTLQAQKCVKCEMDEQDKAASALHATEQIIPADGTNAAPVSAQG